GTTTTGLTASHDGDGHGTNVAGLAAATPNNLYGFAGVGYSTHLLVYKIFPPASATNPCPQANTADEALAITDAVNRGASVINLSLGSPQNTGFDQAEQNAVEAAIANNVTVVAAAGNEFPGSDGQQLDYPAAYSGVVAVGASATVDDNVGASYGAITSENVASYSNSGPTLLAPGGDAHGSGDTHDLLHWIEGYSTKNPDLPTDQCSNSGGVCRALFNGTSQATPQVSGAIALMEAHHGGARSLTPAQVTSMLTSTADNIGVSSTRGGAGRLNVANAVAAAHP
ncbi:MAG: S8 family serine peptidase, partial [Candidatus Eremiobacteraeota bacterium]|nr:S8 family serine peptidase [Candidatus Eremiobacteraeota bacterium]